MYSRIDFTLTGTGALIVNAFPEAWDFRTFPDHDVYPGKTIADLEARLDKLQAEGWTIRRWMGGARAWFGNPRPVRDAGQIRGKRIAMAQAARNETVGYSVDLAFDM